LYEFSPYNQILLSKFDISNTFHNSFLIHIKAKMYQTI